MSHHPSILSGDSDDSRLGLLREDAEPALGLGRWVMVSDTRRVWDEQNRKHSEVPYEWLGCIMGIGSNYVSVAHPQRPNSGVSSVRVHFDDIWTRLRFLSEEEALCIISTKISGFREEVSLLIGEVNKITSRLGLKTRIALSDNRRPPGTALSSLSAAPDVSAYKNALVETSKKTLPDLFQRIKESNGELSRWMTASTLPLQALAGDMNDYVGEIQDRILNISLYAGLVETTIKCCDGPPADASERLHVMQRRCYMDEECLANYKAGGMSFRQINEFDAWLSEPENRDRILPFPRTIVAMRVRREEAEREWDGSLMDAFINIRLAELDAATFLYIRNGEQIWRISTEIDFGAMIFPDKAVYDPSEPMMVKMFAGRVDKMMPLGEYEQRAMEYAEAERLHKEWVADNPFDRWSAENPEQSRFAWEHSNPYRGQVGAFSSFNPKDWSPADSSNVYFDDAMVQIGAEIKRYNRIATIIQGLFDRSEVLLPHVPVQSWTPQGFDQAIKLVYDATQVLHDGEPPDFEAYRKECNSTLGAGSVVTGQDVYWMEQEAARETARRQRDWRLSDGERRRQLKRYTPYGNPGPSVVGALDEWKPRQRAAVFRWSRERREPPFDAIACSISVPEHALLNVSAYKPGDYKRFYLDCRTRSQYVRWAPLLLAAEDWWAKNRNA